MQIILASRNAGKIKEIQHIADSEYKSEFEFLPLPANVPEIPEPFTTYQENALHKARESVKYTNLPVLAEDSGINLPSLNYLPGIYSARYAALGNQEVNNANDELNNQKLLAELLKIPQTESSRRAYYFCACVFMKSPEDQHPLFSQGVWHGEITKELSGDGGFGYDPLFYVQQFNKTSAHLSIAEKCQISHRAFALKKILAEIKTLYL